MLFAVPMWYWLCCGLCRHYQANHSKAIITTGSLHYISYRLTCCGCFKPREEVRSLQLRLVNGAITDQQHWDATPRGATCLAVCLLRKSCFLRAVPGAGFLQLAALGRRETPTGAHALVNMPALEAPATFQLALHAAVAMRQEGPHAVEEHFPAVLAHRVTSRVTMPSAEEVQALQAMLADNYKGIRMDIVKRLHGAQQENDKMPMLDGSHWYPSYMYTRVGDTSTSGPGPGAALAPAAASGHEQVNPLHHSKGDSAGDVELGVGAGLGKNMDPSVTASASPAGRGAPPPLGYYPQAPLPSQPNYPLYGGSGYGVSDATPSGAAAYGGMHMLPPPAYDSMSGHV
jgi:hypothetical protein